MSTLWPSAELDSQGANLSLSPLAPPEPVLTAASAVIWDRSFHVGLEGWVVGRKARAQLWFGQNSLGACVLATSLLGTQSSNAGLKVGDTKVRQPFTAREGLLPSLQDHGAWPHSCPELWAGPWPPEPGDASSWLGPGQPGQPRCPAAFSRLPQTPGQGEAQRSLDN